MPIGCTWLVPALSLWRRAALSEASPTTSGPRVAILRPCSMHAGVPGSVLDGCGGCGPPGVSLWHRGVHFGGNLRLDPRSLSRRGLYWGDAGARVGTATPWARASRKAPRASLGVRWLSCSPLRRLGPINRLLAALLVQLGAPLRVARLPSCGRLRPSSAGFRRRSAGAPPVGVTSLGIPARPPDLLTETLKGAPGKKNLGLRRWRLEDNGRPVERKDPREIHLETILRPVDGHVRQLHLGQILPKEMGTGVIDRRPSGLKANRLPGCQAGAGVGQGGGGSRR